MIGNKVGADPIADELKEYNLKLTQARAALVEAKTFLQSDYIQNFAKILEGGVDKLNVSICFVQLFKVNKKWPFIIVDNWQETTLNELKTTHDAAKRQEVITYAVKAYTRLIKFLEEIKNTIQ